MPRSTYTDSQRKIVNAALDAGVDSSEVAKNLGISKQSMAAFVANRTRKV